MGEPEVIPAPTPALAEDDIRRWVAAWLLGFESRETRRAYGRDLAGWLAFCREHEIDPLRSRPVHVDA